MRFREAIYHTAAWAQGTPFRTELSAALERQYWSQATLRQWQLDKLNALIAHARTTTDYYRGLPTSPLQSLDDIRDLPILNKDALRQHRNQMSSPTGSRGAVSKTTGGSTGAPVTLFKSRRAMAVELAATWRGMSWAGVHPGDKQARFWGVPHSLSGRIKARLTDTATNRFRCSAFAFTASDLRRFHEALLKRRPVYCYGYVSMLRALSDYITSNDLTRPSSLVAVITTAEPLTSPDRRNLESALNAPVFNEYGCGELGTIAHECEQHNLHENQDTHFLEVLDDQGRPANDGDLGHIVLTDLFNYATPLIRYHIADSASSSAVPCDCGRTLRVITELAGREYDMLINKDGDRFHGEFFLYIFEELARNGLSVSAFRITQTGVDDLTLEIAAPSTSIINKVSNYMLDRLRRNFSNSVTLHTKKVDQIPRESSGKTRIIRRLTDA